MATSSASDDWCDLAYICCDVVGVKLYNTQHIGGLSAAGMHGRKLLTHHKMLSN